MTTTTIRPNSIFSVIAIAIALAWFPGVSVSHASALQTGKQITQTSSATGTPPKRAKQSKVKKKPTQPARFREEPTDKYGSRETERQRSERLTRECRGAVNAGACAGYTR